ncbi:ATP-binding cassette domain-containing protein [Heyndrickxia sporothermodurans]
MSSKDVMVIQKAEENNLKQLSLEIPKHKITVFTGVSGSGKSSLVFDTIAAESQRLLNETYSTYIQNQLPHYGRPKVEKIENLPVSIVIDQKRIGGNARSTVGTITDLLSYIRLLYSRIGKPFVGYSNIFSFNHPEGMCSHCNGLGEKEDVDIDALIDFNKSLNEGAIQFPTFQPGGWRWTRYVNSGLFDNDKKIKDYSRNELDLLLYEKSKTLKSPPKEWHKTAKYEGVIIRIQKAFLWKESKGKKTYQKEIKRIAHKQVCSYCNGSRYNDKILSCKINGLSIGELCKLSIVDCLKFVEAIDSSKTETVVSEIIKRLETLIEVGLGYLSLDRSTSTLSGGESQRIKMVRHLNSSLSDIVYIFDEPSVGLHPEDVSRMNKLLLAIRDKGNTVLVVEHDPDMIKIADEIIDIGPFSGKEGGDIVFKGSYSALLKSDTITGKTLRKPFIINGAPRIGKEFLVINDAGSHNLKHLSVQIPKYALTVITGVAGSGKSTLISKELMSRYSDIVWLNQKRIHTTVRSNLATYMGFYDEIRRLFGKYFNISSALFSYNSKGACENCNGLGKVKTDLAFMDDVELVCEVCSGKRFKPEVLEYYINDKNIHDVLLLTVDEAISFLKGESELVNRLSILQKVGLGYIQLGQSLDTFSGGEIQRLKLATKLNSKEDKSIFVFDEPSTGLHESDIQNLLILFNNLIDEGKTVILIEHNLSLISQADWVIDLGPEAGEKGGYLLYEGTIKGLLECKRSVTAKHLLKHLPDN